MKGNVRDNRRGKVGKVGRGTRGVRGLRSRHPNEEELPEEKGSISIYLYLLGFSILLVAGLSFVNFLALPHMDMPSLKGGVHHNVNFASVDSANLNRAFLAARATPAPVSSAVVSSPFSSMYDQGLPPAVSLEQQHGLATPAMEQGGSPSLPVQQPAAQSLPGPVAGNAYDHPGVARVPNQNYHRIDALSAAPAQQAVQVPPSPSTPVGSHSKEASAGGGIAVLEGDTWLRLPKNVDAKEITFGAWIFLPNAPVSAFPQASLSMKTVAATKISGCKAESDASEGWALFVHEWGTFNQQLRLSWTDARLACNELFSETAVVPFDRWVHVGFTFSEVQNSARLFIDGRVIADTKMNLGSLAKASSRVPLSEANIRDRRVQKVTGTMIYGAHAPQSGDAPHVQSHAFFGFLGDMRVLHTAPEDPEQVRKIMTLTSDAMIAQGLVSASTWAVQTAFKAGDQGADVQNQNLADGLPFSKEPDNGRRFQFVAFAEQPKHPWFQMNAAPSDPGSSNLPLEPATPLVPLPTLAPEVLRASWSQEWIQKNGEAKLIESQQKADIVAEEVRAAMVHTWRGYRSKAWGHDDLKPVSGHSKDWCRMGITILDALSTLWLMELKDEFAEATKWLTDHPLPSPGSHGMHSVFEMSIRGLGGLLSAYALSGQQIFLENAHRVADALLHAFNTPSGMPKSQVDVGSGQSKWHTWVHFAVLAEVATVQVEMRYLSHVIGDDTYKRAADRAFDAVLAAAGDRGLIPVYLTQNDEVPRFGNTKISLGAMGDSYYEYLIKQWVQGGKKEDRLKNKWKVAMQEMLTRLVRKTAGGLTYICEEDHGNLRHRMDHLACFVAGMLMMGARELPPQEVDPRWEPTAEALTETCHQMYKRSASGLSPEYVVFHPERSDSQDMTIPNDAPHNLLRPEAAEAMYYMHYYTGDPKYREWASEMFHAFERNSKARYGYAAVRDVRHAPPIQRDDMESFWAAETLKYLYLIQMPRSKLSMEEYVFNTEAHPMPRWVS